MKIRNSNFELLRMVSIILILMMHIGSMTESIDYFQFNSFVTNFISSIGNIGVSCFILISGYFGAKFKPNKFVHIIYITTLYAVISYILISSTGIFHFSYIDLLKSFFIVPLYNNWFITCYLILMLTAPFIDIFILSLEKKTFKNLLIILFVILSFLPTAFNTPYYTVLTMGGKSLTYFMFVYLIGRYIKLNNDILYKKKWLLIIFISSTVIINLLNNSASFILDKTVRIYAMDCSPFILISSISVFYLFKSLQFKSNTINYAASSVLAVYLLDSSRMFLDYHTFKIKNYSNSSYLFFIIIIETIMFFLLAIVFDKIRVFMLSRMENNIIERFLSTKLMRKIYKII